MQVVSIGECMIEMSGGEEGAWRMGFAGDTLNTLWYLRAGLDPAKDRASYFTALGTDGFSDRIAAFLAGNGIDTGFIRRIAGRRPGLYMIEQRDGDRHFTYWRESSAARKLAEDRDALAAAVMAADCVYLSGITLAILTPADREALVAVAKDAREKGAIVAFDPNIRPALWETSQVARETIMAMAKAASIVLPSFDDEAAAFGDADPQATLARYRDAGVWEIVVKNGAADIAFHIGDEHGTLPAAPAVNVVDATGAGDSFNGGYLAARLGGADIETALRAGRDMAARVVGIRGALADFPELAAWKRA